jgi:hypothetical protein
VRELSCPQRFERQTFFSRGARTIMHASHDLLPPPVSGRFLFSPQLPPDRGKVGTSPTELSTYTIAPDALSQIEKLSGCSVVKLLRISSDDEDAEEDVLLHNSQLRVALAELLGIHHEHAKQVYSSPLQVLVCTNSTILSSVCG